MSTPTATKEKDNMKVQQKTTTRTHASPVPRLKAVPPTAEVKRVSVDRNTLLEALTGWLSPETSGLYPSSPATMILDGAAEELDRGEFVEALEGDQAELTKRMHYRLANRLRASASILTSLEATDDDEKAGAA
jgi:hypothetical protein